MWCALMHAFSLLSFVSANSYEDATVYTQALLDITYHKTSTKKDSLHELGKFGKDSPKSMEKGLLIWSAGKDWCNYEHISVQHQPWIALIPKGNCTAVVKLLNAKRNNASAVLIYDNKYQGDIPTLWHKGSGNLVTVMIRRKLGERIISLLKKNPSMKCIITVGTHIGGRQWKVSRTSVLFVLVSFILLMCISLAWLVFYYVQRFRYIYRNDRKEKQLLNAAKKAISKLKTKPFRSSGAGEEEEMCVVCLEDYRENDSLRVLPCNHEFHKSCIDPWLLNHRTCPMCKSNILKSLGVDYPENCTHSELRDSPSGLPSLIVQTPPAYLPSAAIVETRVSVTIPTMLSATPPVMFTRIGSAEPATSSSDVTNVAFSAYDSASTTSSNDSCESSNSNSTRALISKPDEPIRNWTSQAL